MTHTRHSHLPQSSNQVNSPEVQGRSRTKLTSKRTQGAGRHGKPQATAVHHSPTVAHHHAQRPQLVQTASQMDTQYVNMLLAVDGIPRMHNVLASFFTWLLLAGFVLFPGTFSSLQTAEDGFSATANHVLNVIQHVPLFIVAWVCCAVGGIGMCWMWWRWMYNYVWLVNRIFLPGLLNSLAGVISTIVNVYGVQHGEFSTTSKITIIVTAVAAVICGVLTVVYNFWLLAEVKRRHDQQIGKERAGKHGEGFVEKVKRKAREIEPEAGMV